MCVTACKSKQKTNREDGQLSIDGRIVSFSRFEEGRQLLDVDHSHNPSDEQCRGRCVDTLNTSQKETCIATPPSAGPCE